MSELENVKKELCLKVEKILDDKIKTLNDLITSAKESRDSDTKSSVGDKYETSRAMMHIEIGKNESQRNNLMKLKNELSKINVNESGIKVGFGSVVITNKGNYFISVAVGKVSLKYGNYYSISLASPIGMALQGLTVGDVVEFQRQQITIKQIW